MKKIISITGQNMLDMGWSLAETDKPTDDFNLEIDTTPETRRIRLAHDIDGAGYAFDYYEALADLDTQNHLPNGIFQGNSVVYNDHEKEVSSHIQHGEIAEILGDTSIVELKVYSSLSELNAEIEGFSFTTEPKYNFA